MREDEKIMEVRSERLRAFGRDLKIITILCSSFCILPLEYCGVAA